MVDGVNKRDSSGIEHLIQALNIHEGAKTSAKEREAKKNPKSLFDDRKAIDENRSHLGEKISIGIRFGHGDKYQKTH